MGEKSAQKTGFKSYRKNGPTVPSGGGEKTLRAAKKRMQLTNQREFEIRINIFQ